MNLATVAIRNIGRNKLRTTLTVLGVAVAVIAFISLRTLIWSWTANIEQAATDRIGTRHKVSMVVPLPKRYAQEIADIPGVSAVAYANWFGAKDPKHEREFFATLACEPDDILKVYPEIQVPQGDLEAWKIDRQGALVGDVIAKKLGWKRGDRVTLDGTIFPGKWEFRISGIYTATKATVDRSTFWFQWKYLNESLDARRQDQIGWIMTRIDNPGRAAEIAKAIDTHFDDRDTQTLSMSEKQFATSFLGMFGAVLRVIDLVSIVIMVIMMLILGNTIAMGVRERTHEYGVMRAIGFMPRQIATAIMGEALVVGAIGGGLGLALAYPLVERGIGRFLEEQMGAYFAFFRINASMALIAFGLSILLALVAAIIPARQAAGLNVVDSLRRVA